jgi:hypothetical protein
MDEGATFSDFINCETVIMARRRAALVRKKIRENLAAGRVMSPAA